MSGLPRLYFDNAATSFPKPPCVAAAMADFLTRIGASPGRGAYAETRAAEDVVHDCRVRLCRLVGAGDPAQLVFTLNATDALNLAIKGIATHARRRGLPVHVVTSWMDHNSVLRPLRALEADGVTVTRVTGDPATGRIDPDDVAAALRDDTRLVAIVHGSNVTGTLQPVAAIGAACRARGVPFLVDAAQTIGHVPIDVERDAIDLLAFPGHKGLLGPLGTGALWIRPGLERTLDPLREGGTGSRSERDVQPQELPDRYEPGSPNAVGIAGLHAAVGWILDRGVESIRAHERGLMTAMLAGLRDADGVRLLGPTALDERCGVFSVVLDGTDPHEAAARLEREHGVLARAGLHCAPLAHRLVGSDDARGPGALRLSVGPFLTVADVHRATDAVRAVACGALAGTP